LINNCEKLLSNKTCRVLGRICNISSHETDICTAFEPLDEQSRAANCTITAGSTDNTQVIMTKCKECNYKVLEKGNGSPNRYYCTHPDAIKDIGSRLICRTDRGSEEIKIKNSPKWCPLKQ
jgi:hypothetical protein